MYYKFTIEKLDPEMNTFQKTQVMVTQEMVKDASLEFDVLKFTASDLVDRFRHEFGKEKFNTNQENPPDSTNGYTYYPQEHKTIFNTKEK